MASEFFINLSLILIIAVVVSAVTRILRQPLIIGYIFTGIIVGPYALGVLSDTSVFQIFSQIGVAFLLFVVGLHLNPRVIKEVGWVSLATGTGQVLFASVIGFLVAEALGFSTTSAFYLAIALSFSSTIIITKLLSDKKDLESLYGKIAVGSLIVQDVIAVLILMVISSFSSGGNLNHILISSTLKGVVAIGVVLLFGYFILPKLTYHMAKSQEFLFLFALGWCFALGSLLQALGFSIEIGALLAGVTLAMSQYNSEISAKMKPLRDFFLVIFFVILGSQMVIQHVSTYIVAIILFSLLVLVLKPLMVIVLMGLMGYTKRNSFLTGLTGAQISEFSLILVILGIRVGHLTPEILSVVTAVGLITIAVSTYLVTYGTKIYPSFENILSVFERRRIREQRETRKEYDVILFGYNRIGFNLLRSLKKIRKSYVVVDFNPETIEHLKRMDIPAIYGDAYDADFLEELPLEKTRLIISTIPEFETNMLLVERAKKENKDIIVIVRASQIHDALDLYKKGADYVLTPHFLGGEFLSRMVQESSLDAGDYEKEKEKHLKLLKEMLAQRPERRREFSQD